MDLGWKVYGISGLLDFRAEREKLPGGQLLGCFF
jgi:hypothetical protein